MTVFGVALLYANILCLAWSIDSPDSMKVADSRALASLNFFSPFADSWSLASLNFFSPLNLHLFPLFTCPHIFWGSAFD